MADAGSSNQVEEVLAKVDLAEIVGEYVSLKKSGRSLKGLCPFHEEKTPSFFVSPEKQVFYCFGCGAGGNAITFVKNIEKVSFGEALEQVARRAGITLTSANAEGNREKQQIYQANRWAAGVYQKVLFLPEGKVGLNYLSSRGLGEEEIKRYGLGYAPAQPDFLLSRMKQEGLNPTVLKKAGLIDSSGTRDIFRRRVLFTIYDIRGEILGFGGRAVEEHQEPKYLNTGETPVFSKGRVLYGLNWAREGIREAGYALMVEGYFDVLRLHQHGFRNAVAPLGTALTDGHLRLLRRFTARLLLLFDADEAG
ncbi:MAG TPA: DNA primase, partial [bacterium]|nr:DNA primase [bacterium]